MLNPICEALDVPLLQITEQSLKLGTKVAQMYSDDNWYAFQNVNGHLKGHYSHALAVNNGMTESLESPNFYYPDKVPIPIKTMDELIQKVHHGVISFMPEVVKSCQQLSNSQKVVRNCQKLSKRVS